MTTTCSYCNQPTELDWDETGTGFYPSYHFECMSAPGEFAVVGADGVISTHRFEKRAREQADYLAAANTPFNGRRFRVWDGRGQLYVTPRMDSFVQGVGWGQPPIDEPPARYNHLDTIRSAG